MHDINIHPKPQPSGGDEPPGGVDQPPPPPADEPIDTPPGQEEPETEI